MLSSTVEHTNASDVLGKLHVTLVESKNDVTSHVHPRTPYLK